MEMTVDLGGELFADSFNSTEVVYSRSFDPLKTSKVLHQVTAAFRTNARNYFKRRHVPSFSALQTMAGDRETVRLIPDLLYEVERQ